MPVGGLKLARTGVFTQLRAMGSLSASVAVMIDWKPPFSSVTTGAGHWMTGGMAKLGAGVPAARERAMAAGSVAKGTSRKRMSDSSRRRLGDDRRAGNRRTSVLDGEEFHHVPARPKRRAPAVRRAQPRGRGAYPGRATTP